MSNMHTLTTILVMIAWGPAQVRGLSAGRVRCSIRSTAVLIRLIYAEVVQLLNADQGDIRVADLTPPAPQRNDTTCKVASITSRRISLPSRICVG